MTENLPPALPERPNYAPPEPPPLGSPGHDEGLLDAAIEQSFPASDPPATTQPGSMLNMTAQQSHDTARSDEDRQTLHHKRG